ncbi:MAG: hypothetical protein H7X71_04770 [Chitinophagales bacterium]|nr:hypothetical protein [Chitinophagales bacterium]
MQRSLIYTIFFLFTLSCGARKVDVDAPQNKLILSDMPDKATIINNYRASKKMLVICNDHDTTLIRNIEAFANSMKQYREEFIFTVLKASEVSDSLLQTNPLYVIGTYAENSVLQKLKEKLPLIIEKDQFSFDHKTYTDENDLIKLSFYPSPFNTYFPVTIITGNSENAVHNYVDDLLTQSWGYFFWESWGYQIFQEQRRVVLGNFSEDPSTLWQMDKKQHWEFDYKGSIAAENDIFIFLDHNAGLKNYFLDSVNQILKKDADSLRMLSENVITEKIQFHMYPSTEVKGLMTNNTDRASIDFEKNEVHAVLQNAYAGNNAGKTNELLARKLFGKPGIDALERGIAVAHTQNWNEKGSAYWGNILKTSGNMPPLEKIIDNEIFHNSSPIFMDIAASELVQFLSQKLTIAVFINRYQTITKAEILQYRNEWQQYISIGHKRPLEDNRMHVTAELPRPVNGFNFAHEGYEVFNGYGGTTAVHALEMMKQIGTNSVAIIPYTGSRDLNKPAPFRMKHGPGGENDESVIHSIYEAKKLGMTVMLKPQVWSGNMWNGDMQMKNESDWKLFFQYYEDWIMHYAMLAEMYAVDIFCVGVEFKNATTTHEKEWRTIFQKVRKIFSGKITYAANWGYEFDTVTFWDELDYISVNSYYPLSDKTDVSDEELLQNFEKILDHLETYQKKYDKPFLFTEIGYKSIDYPWLRPHADDDEQNINMESQRRCYEVMFKAMEDENWISGIYLWQWPSYMDYVKENPKGFTPCTKPAEKVVARYYLNK